MIVANDGMMNGFMATYLASPQGQEMVHRYLSSPEGQRAIREYLLTPKGKQTARILLPALLEAIDLPDRIRIALEEIAGRKA